jgi:arylsulfatase A-like enzyme
MRYGIQRDWYHDEKHVDEYGYATELITDEAVSFLKRQKKERQFFLHLAYNAPHFGKGWDPTKKLAVNIMQPHPKDLARVKHITDPIRRMFAAKVVNLDDGIGRVLAALKANGQARDTLVIFMTDHGGDYAFGGSNKPFRGEKATLFEGGIRVPCLMRWPGKIKAGSTSDTVLSALDLFPTFCRLGGVDTAGRQLDGRDIKSILTGVQKTLPSRELFWHTGSHAELKRGEWTALRQGDWKFLETAKGEQHLFNLAQDPHEKANLMAQHPKLFNDLRKRRDALLKECLPK